MNGTSTYKYINGNPLLIEVAEEKKEDGKTITTVKRRVKGKLRLVTRKVEKAE